MWTGHGAAHLIHHIRQAFGRAAGGGPPGLRQHRHVLDHRLGHRARAGPCGPGPRSQRRTAARREGTLRCRARYRRDGSARGPGVQPRDVPGHAHSSSEAVKRIEKHLTGITRWGVFTEVMGWSSDSRSIKPEPAGWGMLRTPAIALNPSGRAGTETCIPHLIATMPVCEAIASVSLGYETQAGRPLVSFAALQVEVERGRQRAVERVVPLAQGLYHVAADQ